MTVDIPSLSQSISDLAAAINRLAATQEKPVATQVGHLTVGVAKYVYEDPQTGELRRLEKDRQAAADGRQKQG